MSGRQPEPNRVKAAREAIGLRREGLAFKAGISMKTVESIEGGRVDPHPLTKRAIADVLGADPEDLFPLEEAAA